jgi:hypothetical protein
MNQRNDRAGLEELLGEYWEIAFEESSGVAATGNKGTVSGQVGPKAWDVTFDAKVAKPVTGKAAMEFQSFHVTELGVLE